MKGARRTTKDWHRFAFIIGLSVLTQLLIACGGAPDPSADLTVVTPASVPDGLYVDPALELGPISPYVYGSNFGPWLAIPLQVYQQAVYARLTFMRFPAGSWGDMNNVTERQIDQFIKLCGDLGCEPMINVRLLGGTAQQAADMVKYTNFTKGYNVRYWGIGNEPNLYGDGYDIARFNREWREWASAMRAVDPSIILIGPETSQFYADPQDASQQVFVDWLVEFLKANGDMVDIVSVHRYPFPKTFTSGPPSIADLRESSREWDAIIPALREHIREHTARDLPIGITEVNSSWARNLSGEATMDSHYNAIWWGDVLGRLIREDVNIVAQFDVVREWGILGPYDPHPMYYVYLMYQRFGSERAFAVSDDPYVSIFAAKRPDGALTLMVVNLASEPVDKPLTLNDLTSASAETWLFDSTRLAERVEDTSLAASTQLHLPAESMTLLILPRQ